MLIKRTPAVITCGQLTLGFERSMVEVEEAEWRVGGGREPTGAGPRHLPGHPGSPRPARPPALHLIPAIPGKDRLLGTFVSFGG